MNIGNIVGAALGIKLVNGEIKPKFGIGAILIVAVMSLFFIGFFFSFAYGIINLNYEFIIMSSIGICSFGYLLMINPYTQKSSNYYIEFQNENSLAGFKLSYKGKLVNIQHKIDNDGKIAFANNSSKLSCISYADGTKMSNLVKYKIINYFTKWLNDNKLLSSEVTSTFEQL